MIVGRTKEEATFKDQIAWYMQHLQTRNRGRAKPATLALYQAFSNNHVLPAYVASDEDLDPAFFEQPAPTPTQEELDAELARLEELRAILEGVN